MLHQPTETRVFTREEARALDQCAIDEFAMPSIVLMENAAAALEETALSMLEGEPPGSRLALVLAGPGNNGGDGLALARRLANRGVPAGVVLCAPREKYKGDALTNLRICERMDLPLHTLDADDPDASLTRITNLWAPLGCRTPEATDDDLLIIDALLGTGLTDAPRAPIDTVIEWANRVRGRRGELLAVDVPSGLDCDTGTPAGGGPAIHADTTLTLAGLKPGLLEPHARPHTGRVLVGDIGVPAALLRRFGSPAPD